MEVYLQVRRAHFDEGRSQRSIARDFGLARGTVKKMCAYPVPPGYQRVQDIRRPMLDGFTDKIDQWLLEDLDRPKKQRHTVKRIHERLRDEEGFTGGYTTVKDYVRAHRRVSREMFIPLAHPPGHGQADFGEAVAVIGGVEQKLYFFAFDLPHSDACYIRAYPAATSEAWMDGHVHAFAFFGVVPLSVVYDNDSCLVAKIEADGRRRRTQMFTEMLSHYLFDDRYGRPGKGNDKGNVEGLVGWSRRNLMVPLPEFPDIENFNVWLEEQCRKRQSAVLHGHTETIEERLQRDLAAMRPLPAAPYEACAKATGRVSSQSLVRYRTNDYSVPSTYGFRDVTIRAFVDVVEIGCGGEIIARHPRCYEREQMVFNPVHYFALLERKPGALDQAAPLADWEMPEELQTLRRLMEARQARQGRREFVQVLRLLESFELPVLCAAVRVARIMQPNVWKDYRIKNGDRQKIMRLATPEFIRRFLIHVLPDGFHRIRHYGLLASGARKANLTRIRALLCVLPPDQADVQDAEADVTPLTLREPCPCCGGPMRIIEIFRRGQKPMSRAPPREQAA